MLWIRNSLMSGSTRRPTIGVEREVCGWYGKLLQILEFIVGKRPLLAEGLAFDHCEDACPFGNAYQGGREPKQRIFPVICRAMGQIKRAKGSMCGQSREQDTILYEYV